MRTISAQEITDTVARLCIEANTRLPQDVQAALDKARQEEPWPLARNTLDLLWSNLSAAKEKDLPICQDTWPTIRSASPSRLNKLNVRELSGSVSSAGDTAVKKGT